MNKKIINEFINTTHEIQRLMEKQSCISYNKKIVPRLQFFALKVISEEKKITIGELAEILSMSSGAVAQLVERLIEKRWVVKEIDEKDKRISHLLLTKEGEKEISKMEMIFQKKMTAMLSLISEKDLEYMLEIFKKLLVKLKGKNAETI